MPPLSKIAPHTAAKHLLLGRYLGGWFPIMGKFNGRLNYIDGFAGPGEYEGGEPGSPILAIEAARSHLAAGSLPSHIDINFVFVEARPANVATLTAKLDALSIPKQFDVEVFPGEFADVIGGQLDKIEESGKGLAPTFAFVDPFGFSGIPFDLLSRILRFPKCEVFINVMVDFINRFLEHPDDQVVAHFPRTFGTDEVLDIPKQAVDERSKAILDLYRRQLKTVAKFVGRFDMHGKRDQKIYSLFFASNSATGFLKMKEAMWAVDKAEGSKFSDADPGESYAFELFSFWPLWDQMHARFAGQRVLMEGVDRFVVEETDFLPTHARIILKECERKGEVVVEGDPGYRRRAGTFRPDKVSITFPGPDGGPGLF